MQLIARSALFLFALGLWQACESSPSRPRPSSTKQDAAARQDARGGSGGQGGTGGMAGSGGTGGSAGTGGSGGTGGTSGVDAASGSDARDAAATDGRADAASGPDAQAPDATGSDAAPIAPTFANVKKILIEHCSGCHEPAEKQHTDFATEAGLLARLVNIKPTYSTSAACRSQVLVTARDLTKSLLYQKIIPNGALAGCGRQMPPQDLCKDIEGLCLSPEQIKAIGDWIVMGAKP